jgi:hypothetical protein
MVKMYYYISEKQRQKHLEKELFEIRVAMRTFII